MLRFLWRLLVGDPRPSEVRVHVVEWPSGREQGWYDVPTDRDSAIYAYPPGTDHYIDTAFTLSICDQPPASQQDQDQDQQGPGDRAISPRSE